MFLQSKYASFFKGVSHLHLHLLNNTFFFIFREEFVQNQCCTNRVELGLHVYIMKDIRLDEFLHDCF